MKAEELMVGDWVNVFCDVYIKAKVTKEDFGNPTFFPRTKPIPITPEILEKNGFEKNVSPYVTSLFDWESEDGRIVINHLSNMVGRDWSIHIDNEDYQTIGSADIKYVHELQHALRLCDVNKEIEL